MFQPHPWLNSSKELTDYFSRLWDERQPSSSYAITQWLETSSAIFSQARRAQYTSSLSRDQQSSKIWMAVNCLIDVLRARTHEKVDGDILYAIPFLSHRPIVKDIIPYWNHLRSMNIMLTDTSKEAAFIWYAVIEQNEPSCAQYLIKHGVLNEPLNNICRRFDCIFNEELSHDPRIFNELQKWGIFSAFADSPYYDGGDVLSEIPKRTIEYHVKKSPYGAENWMGKLIKIDHAPLFERLLQYGVRPQPSQFELLGPRFKEIYEKYTAATIKEELRGVVTPSGLPNKGRLI